MRAHYRYILLLAAAIFLVSAIEAVSVVAPSRQTKLVVSGALQATHGDGKRLLRRTHETGEEDDKVDSYNADSEERDFQAAAKELSAKLGAKRGAKWKTMINKDFRNLRLFLGEASFEELYRKGATPYKLFAQMGRNDISKAGAIDERWGAYFTYWVKKKAGVI